MGNLHLGRVTQHGGEGTGLVATQGHREDGVLGRGWRGRQHRQRILCQVSQTAVPATGIVEGPEAAHQVLQPVW